MTDALGGDDDDDDDGACIIEHSLQPQYCSNHGPNLHSHPDPVRMFQFPFIHSVFWRCSGPKSMWALKLDNSSYDDTTFFSF